MNNNLPKISVIIPCYNAEKYLSEALDSIIKQTFKDIEIICVDDCSTDKTNTILQKYAKKDKRIKIFKNKKNTGIAGTLNLAISKTNPNSKYIARMDSDDIALPNRLKEQWNYMEKNPDMDISGTWFKIFAFRNEIIKLPTEHKDIVKRLFELCPFGHPTVIFRKSFIDKNNMTYRNVTSEDYDLWARCFVEYKAKFGNLNKVLLKYRIHSDQHTRPSNQKKICISVQETKKYLRKHKKFQFYIYSIPFKKKNIKDIYIKDIRRWLIRIKLNKKEKIIKLFGFYLLR
ncbi:glycosyltransferase family 2 protein, partial [Pseudomonadota bacterium]